MALVTVLSVLLQLFGSPSPWLYLLFNSVPFVLASSSPCWQEAQSRGS